jgi:N-methylhydantoinase A
MSATLCAWGALYADLASDHTAPLNARFDAFDPSAARAIVEGLRRAGTEILARNGLAPEQRVLEVAADIRYVGQYDDITVPLEPGEWDFADTSALVARFHAAHDALNGYASPGHPCELTALHLTARGVVDKPALAGSRTLTGEVHHARRRRIWLEGGAVEVAVIDVTRLGFGEIVTGPAIVELPGSTLVLRPGFQAGIDRAGNLLAFRADRRSFAERLGGSR